MVDRAALAPDDAPRAPSGAILFTVEILDENRDARLIKTSASDAQRAAWAAMQEFAEDHERVQALGDGDDGLAPHEADEFETEKSMVIDDLEQVRVWAGHLDAVPDLPPLYEE